MVLFFLIYPQHPSIVLFTNFSKHPNIILFAYFAESLQTLFSLLDFPNSSQHCCLCLISPKHPNTHLFI